MSFTSSPLRRLNSFCFSSFCYQACFLGFELAMKFLNWLAPNLWRRLGVTSFVIPGKRTHGSEEILKNFQLFDCFWNILVQCNTWMVQTCWESIGKCWLENRDGLAVTMPTHTQHTHSVECSHSFCFTFFFFKLSFLCFKKMEWSEHVPYLLSASWWTYQGKGAFSRALCAGLSATHTSELSASCTVTLHSVIDNTTFTFCLTNVKL